MSRRTTTYGTFFLDDENSTNGKLSDAKKFGRNLIQSRGKSTYDTRTDKLTTSLNKKEFKLTTPQQN